MKDKGELDIDWNGLAAILNKELYADESEYLGECAYRKKYQAARMFYDEVFSKQGRGSDYLDEIRRAQNELRKERVKLQTEKNEYLKWIREEARDELYLEKVVDAIRNTVGRQHTINDIPVVHSERAGVLCIADAHFGKEFTIRGVFNNIINEYSPEVFYNRMEALYNETIEQVKKNSLSVLRVYNLGDSIDGFLRNSQIWTLRYGAIDSSIMFGNYMGDWLRKLSASVNVIYAQTDGNHDEFRLLDGRKGQHLCESAGKIIRNCITLKNQDNKNFQSIENDTGFIYDEVCGYGVFGLHGEVKDVTTAMKEYENIYRVSISYLIGGHKHHSYFQSCGAKKGCVGVGSIAGVDDFSMSLRQCADATATLLLFEAGKGKIDEHTFVLN